MRNTTFPRFWGAKNPFMRSFLCFKVIYKVKGDFQGHLGQKVAAKIDFLDFSFIVLISVDTNFNISTIQNYRYKFDTNTTYVYIQRVKDTNHCLWNLLHTCTVAHSKFQLDCTCSCPCMQPSTHSGIAICIHSWHLVDQSNNSIHVLVLAFHSQLHSVAFEMWVTLKRDCF